MDKNFQVYKSSAGSGKTFTLVKEFLKICFQENPYYFSSILAITFTNKATQEMKERILDSLVEMAEPQKKPTLMAEILAKELGLNSVDIQEKATKILSAILHNYGDFSISTIDRFSHRLIRTFAKDLKLPMNFQVEIDNKRILEESVGSLINEVGRNKEITNELISFVVFRMDDEKSWRLEEVLKNFTKNLLQDSNEHYIAALKKTDNNDFKELKLELSRYKKEVESEFEKLKFIGIDLIEKNGIELSSFAHGTNGFGKYFYKIDLSKPDSFIRNSYVEKTIEEDKWFSGKTTAIQKEAINSVKGELLECIEAINLFLINRLPIYYAYEAISQNIYSLSLIKEIDARISKYKEDERLLPISDFNQKIAAVVLTESVPYIYVRLGERYNHLMIDEFQDTSVLQFMNLLPLVENSLAEGKMNLIVGDAKQAIYRFRGGEVKQLAEMPHYLPEQYIENDFVKMRMETLQQQYEDLSLKTNYRSLEEVVHFNNSFFKFLSFHETLLANPRKVFEGYEQQIKTASKGGMVEVIFHESIEKEIHINYTLDCVEEALNDGYLACDIAILCRKKDEVEWIANALKNKGIPVVSSEALLIKNQKQVQFLINIAVWLGNPIDIKAKKDILVYLKDKGILEQELEFYLMEYVKDNKPLDDLFFTHQLKLNRDRLSILPLHTLFENIIRTVGLDQEYDIYLQFLQEAVATYVQRNGNNLTAFLDWWEEYQDKLALDIPNGTNAVEILTIHSSKGLDYPVVVIPFLKKLSRPLNGDIWVPKVEGLKAEVPYMIVELNKVLESSVYSKYYREEEERDQSDKIHLLYVAFTRAAERMYLSCDPPAKTDNISNSNLLMGYIQQLNKQPTEEGGHQYLWGDKTKVNHIKKDREEYRLFYHSYPWDEKLKISRKAIAEWTEIEGTDGRQYGNLLHNILASIEDSSDIEDLVESYFQKGIIQLEEIKVLTQKLTTIISHTALKEYFKKGVKSKREANLITENGVLLRPDLVVFLADKWVVVDYKTGDKNEAHQQQLQQYLNALSKMTDLRVEGLLFYTADLSVQKVA